MIIKVSINSRLLHIITMSTNLTTTTIISSSNISQVST